MILAIDGEIMLWGEGFRAGSLSLRPILRYVSAVFVWGETVAGQFDGKVSTC